MCVNSICLHDCFRYKIVVVVQIGQNTNQGVRVASRCLWDDKRDTFASASFSNKHMWAVGEVYAVLME